MEKKYDPAEHEIKVGGDISCFKMNKIEWEEGKLAQFPLSLLNLKIFIYLLLQNHLTVGDLTDLLEEARTTNAAQFTNKTLYTYTCEIIERLLEER